MNYPLISEYVEAIKAAEDNFEKLRYLRPVLSDDGLPVMTSGNFAVVFKMRDERDGRLYAVKCFTKEQTGRAEAYHQIAEELKDVDSPYLVSLRYLEKELFVDTDQTDETEFPVLQMDWVEGKTLDKYLRENLDDKYALEMLAYRFSQLAQWLIPQPFAHGDLKPDNIIVREDGSLVLVDYDGMYVPSMKGQKARELGSPDFRHPQRTENDFDEHIDDFSLVSILLSLKIISIYPSSLDKYGASDRLLFSKEDYTAVYLNQLIKDLFPSKNHELNKLICVFVLLLNKIDFDFISKCHLTIDPPLLKRIVVDSEFIDIMIDMTFLLLKHNNCLDYEKYKEIVKREVGNVSSSKLQIVFSTTLEMQKQMEFAKTMSTSPDTYEERILDSDGAYYSVDGIKLLGFSPNNRIQDNYRIKDGTLLLCDMAFKNCNKESYNLKEISIPSSVIAIGANPFIGCKGLNIICDSPFFKIENGLLYDRFFTRLISNVNTADVSIDVNTYAKVIGAYSFSYSKAKNVGLPKSLSVIEEFAFANSAIEFMLIPSSVCTIGDKAFQSCSNLTDVLILGIDTEIAKTGFEGCMNIEHVFVLESRVGYYRSVFPIIADKFAGIGNYDDVFVSPQFFAQELYKMGMIYWNSGSEERNCSEATKLFKIAETLGLEITYANGKWIVKTENKDNEFSVLDNQNMIEELF